MNALCITPSEKARNAHGRVLQAMQRTGIATSIAVAMGTSEATVLRLKNEHTESVLHLIYLLGFKIVGADKTCIDPQVLQVLRQTTARVLADEEQSKKLFEEGE